MGLEEYSDMLSPEEMGMMKASVMQDLVNLHSRIVDLLPKARANPGNPDLVYEIYRAFHSISGTAGMIQLNNIREISVPAEAASKARKLASEPFTAEELSSFETSAREIGKILEENK